LVWVSQWEKTTKKGAVFLNCTTEKNIDEVRNAIQANVGHGYEVTEPNSFKGRIKLYFIHEDEKEMEDEVLVQKIINQNELNPNNVEIKILYKSKVVNKKFNMVLEVNNYVLNSLMKKDKINIGWNRCRFEQDYGVVRCFNCCKYGHIASKCTSQEVCPICGEITTKTNATVP
jgi:rubrerythrin